MIGTYRIERLRQFTNEIKPPVKLLLSNFLQKIDKRDT